jgi:hypothetical protein
LSTNRAKEERSHEWLTVAARGEPLKLLLRFKKLRMELALLLLLFGVAAGLSSCDASTQLQMVDSVRW